jgi:hypothetical protein
LIWQWSGWRVRASAGTACRAAVPLTTRACPRAAAAP